MFGRVNRLRPNKNKRRQEAYYDCDYYDVSRFMESTNKNFYAKALDELEALKLSYILGRIDDEQFKEEYESIRHKTTEKYFEETSRLQRFLLDISRIHRSHRGFRGGAKK